MERPNFGQNQTERQTDHDLLDKVKESNSLNAFKSKYVSSSDRDSPHAMVFLFHCFTHAMFYTTSYCIIELSISFLLIFVNVSPKFCW